ncbi:MAG: 16S rRNA (uracil(1498)-N(3))-methyltransferase [Abditibacteriota bacterium]|nr:16S rRNA (uracil(1498)-N(3))-methyltransferase [Abditibacteriota bacterium]
MRHYRFFVPPENVSENLVTLPDDVVRQLTKVLRAKPGEKITIIDGTGREYECLFDGREQSEIVSESKCICDPEAKVTLIQVLPKGEKIDLILRMITELGAGEMVIALSERAVSRPDAKSAEKKMKRLEKIAAESAEQCGRSVVTKITGIISFDEAVKMGADYDLRLFAYEEEEKNSLDSILHETNSAKSAIIFIGCEGGFTKEEADSAVEAGWTPVSLGKRILRADTAAVATVARVAGALKT